MEKPDVSSLLSGLEPTTEYAEFLKAWDAISEARGRQIKLKAIYEALAKESVLTISYVTFTRFVKKKLAEDEAGNVAPRPAQVRKEKPAAGVAVDKAPGNETQYPPAAPEEVDKSDKSERVATEAAEALAEAQRASTSKNYSKNLRNRS